MLKPWLKSFKNIFKTNASDKFIKKLQKNHIRLELMSLEERLNLSTVFITYDSTLGVLTLNTETDPNGSDSSYTSFQSTGSEDNILNFIAPNTIPSEFTLFKNDPLKPNAVDPGAFVVNPGSSGSTSVQIITTNLPGFSKIVSRF